MKLMELEIKNFRGIKSLQIKPHGKNFLILGPNGSGKTTIVDAIDFLLTGEISHMKGNGTRGITLKKHGPHVDSAPEDSIVKALVKLPGIEDPVEIKRSPNHQRTLICDEAVKKKIKPTLEMAKRGQHVLTRREILNYVNADSSTRFKQIQTLLKIKDVKETRKALVKVKNALKNEYDAATSSLNSIKTAIIFKTGSETFNEEKIILFINNSRKILGGKPINQLNASILKEDIVAPAFIRDNNINTELLGEDIKNVRKIISDEDLGIFDLELRGLKAKLYSNPHLEDAVDGLKLTRRGLELMDVDKCPLCDTPWAPGKLKDHLKNKIKTFEAAAHDLDRITELLNELKESADNVKVNLKEITKSAKILELENESEKLEVWMDDLERFSSLIESETYLNPDFTHRRVEVLLAPDDLSQILDKIYSAASINSPKPSMEQTAWDNLTRLEDNLKAFEAADKEERLSHEAYKKAEILLNSFLESRNSILDDLYNEIKDRFVELYRQIHGDEENFDALLVSDGAGLDFKVNFHGRGVNPPHALHSEGHQDTMGICLYLALAEHITEGYIDIIILDDVMTSVDAPHRREICRLLAGYFKGRQFFITTHDRTWANQLRTEGVINTRQVVELYNWNIETGPSVSSHGNIWDGIENDLIAHDVSSAAFELRRGSEEFFRSACDLLQAEVIFRDNGRWGLGDFIPAALSKYKELLKKAKDAANSWGNRDEVLRLKEIDDHSRDVFERLNVERWALNTSVHYNNWAEFTVEDFRPVVDSFKDLFDVFQCPQCDGMLRVSGRGEQADNVRCNCGAVNWNLDKKP
ncbi:AAA family ATPase [Methanobacterium paludis]|uniref:SMC domain protein n=1 Tax=Methanobacterium paludis (strain DSM 25820 / JCM 18151 / SWAN1) TaxID=868131 RepID=F6D1Q8_METPW|nr:AAA family ATPase [Methanobacterium paludis]AEG17861.1 SMC domain protein [Methanobacterium paludis]